VEIYQNSIHTADEVFHNIMKFIILTIALHNVSVAKRSEQKGLPRVLKKYYCGSPCDLGVTQIISPLYLYHSTLQTSNDWTLQNYAEYLFTPPTL
jgi:hypothetical protein